MPRWSLVDYASTPAAPLSHNAYRFTYRNLDLGRIGRLRIYYAFGRRLSSHRSNRDSRAPQSLCSTCPFPLRTQKHLPKLRAAVLLAHWRVHHRPWTALHVLVLLRVTPLPRWIVPWIALRRLVLNV